MAKDHFKEHYYQKDRVDWNFNILVGMQPDVARMAGQYAPILTAQDGLYIPVPAQWLHMTILRVGLVGEYTEDEMHRVADVLAPKLARLRLPELAFDSWWQWGGNIVFHVSPHDELSNIYDAVIEALQEVIGEGRTAKTPHGHFIPHVTLAYTKERHNEVQTNDALGQLCIKPAHFHAPSLVLIRQWPADGHYEWEVVRELPMGQKAPETATIDP